MFVFAGKAHVFFGHEDAERRKGSDWERKASEWMGLSGGGYSITKMPVFRRCLCVRLGGQIDTLNANARQG